MDWVKIIIIFLRNVITGVIITALILGLIGFLLGGKEGIVNGVTWGVVLGLIGGCFSGFALIVKYWSDYAGRYGDWWVKKETEGDQ